MTEDRPPTDRGPGEAIPLSSTDRPPTPWTLDVGVLVPGLAREAPGAAPDPGPPVPGAVRSALDLIPDAAAWLGPDDVVRATNDWAVAMFRGPVVGAPFGELVTASAAAAEPGVVTSGRPGEGRRLDGVPFAVEVSSGPVAGGRLCTLREPRPEVLSRTAERHFDAAFETAPIGMALFDPDGRYIRVNDALCAMLDRPEADLLGRRDQEFTHPDDRAADVDAAWRILRGDRDTHQCEKRFVRPDGRVVWAIANLSFLRDGYGRPISWVAQFQDITARRRDEERLRRMADHDPLTGLLNRRAFARELHERLGDDAGPLPTGAAPAVGGLLVLDLDRFKAINDAHGHPAGDEILVRCAVELRAAAATNALVARLGGDEFAIFAPGLDDGALRALADRAAAAIGTVAAGTPLGVSVGIAPVAAAGGCADALLLEADRRMYAAKPGVR